MEYFNSLTFLLSELKPKFSKKWAAVIGFLWIALGEYHWKSDFDKKYPVRKKI